MKSRQFILCGQEGEDTKPIRETWDSYPHSCLLIIVCMERNLNCKTFDFAHLVVVGVSPLERCQSRILFNLLSHGFGRTVASRGIVQGTEVEKASPLRLALSCAALTACPCWQACDKHGWNYMPISSYRYSQLLFRYSPIRVRRHLSTRSYRTSPPSLEGYRYNCEWQRCRHHISSDIIAWSEGEEYRAISKFPWSFKIK